MDDNRDGAVEQAGEEPVKAIYAAYDVICPRAGASNESGASNGSGVSNGPGASNGSGGKVDVPAKVVAPAAGSGAEQDRINKRTWTF